MAQLSGKMAYRQSISCILAKSDVQIYHRLEKNRKLMIVLIFPKYLSAKNTTRANLNRHIRHKN